MEENKYAKAYKQVYEILKTVSQEDIKKIPQDLIKMIESKMDKTYDYKIDPTQKLDKQEISKQAKEILAIIYIDYWATNYEKERINRKLQYDIKMSEKRKQELYNTQNIFYGKHQRTDLPTQTTELVLKKKENLFIKILKKIKNIFFYSNKN